MTVESASFEILAEPPVPEWIVRVTAKGSGFVVRAIPLSARVGDVPIEGLLTDDDRNGFVGYLRAVPPDGAHLFVGYNVADLVDTGIEFNAPPNV
jgi:hypothetical protein